jgi:hypothetical protein
MLLKATPRGRDAISEGGFSGGLESTRLALKVINLTRPFMGNKA